MQKLHKKVKVKTGSNSSAAYREQVVRLSRKVKPVAVSSAYRPSK
jgi:hypothetical protein